MKLYRHVASHNIASEIIVNHQIILNQQEKVKHKEILTLGAAYSDAKYPSPPIQCLQYANETERA